jgi:UDP-3-O-[3-hydroxymyristoyl] glucosamine N-acyltransferase
VALIGRMVIGDDGEIAASASIDRGSLDDSLIGDGGKLDNQIRIGDSLSLGDHAANGRL